MNPRKIDDITTTQDSATTLEQRKYNRIFGDVRKCCGVASHYIRGEQSIYFQNEQSITKIKLHLLCWRVTWILNLEIHWNRRYIDFACCAFPLDLVKDINWFCSPTDLSLNGSRWQQSRTVSTTGATYKAWRKLCPFIYRGDKWFLQRDAKIQNRKFRILTYQY